MTNLFSKCPATATKKGAWSEQAARLFHLALRSEAIITGFFFLLGSFFTVFTLSGVLPTGFPLLNTLLLILIEYVIFSLVTFFSFLCWLWAK